MSERYSWCKHRTAFDYKIKVCKAGIDYHQFERDESGQIIKGSFNTMPCLGRSTERCAGLTAWSAEEIAQREADMAARMSRVGVIRPAIVAEADATGRGGGTIPCPACGTGTVSWSRARSNGHVHARCSTPMCASWME